MLNVLNSYKNLCSVGWLKSNSLCRKINCTIECCLPDWQIGWKWYSVFIVYTLYALECVDLSRLTDPHSKWMIGVLRHLANPLRRIFFSYYKGVFTLYSVYFSVTFKKSKKKKVKQTTFRYKYDNLRNLVCHLFFCWDCRFLDVRIYGLAPVLSVMHERQFDWLTHAFVAQTTKC